MAKGIIRALGEELRERRRDKGLTQEELAAEAGCHRNYIGLLERGQRNATVLILQALAGALGITVSALMLRAEWRQ